MKDYGSSFSKRCILFLHLLDPDRMDDTGLGQAGIGEAAVLGPRLAAPWVNCTDG